MQRPYLRNATVLIGDFFFFMVGFAFIDPVVILPAFSQELADSSLLIGLLTAVRLLMITLPQLVAASILMSSDRKKPLLLLSSIGGRLPILLLAGATLLWAVGQPGLVVAVLIVAVALFYISEGLNSISWPDLVGKVIPESIRGRFLGAGQLVSSLGALAAGVALQRILASERWAYPSNWALIFVIGFVFVMASVVCIALVKEERETREVEAHDLLKSARRMWRDLRTDVHLQRIVGIQILLGIATTVFPFFVVRARELVPGGNQVLGVYIVLQNVGGMAAALICGHLIDHVGSWSALRVGAIAQVLAFVAAIAAGVLGMSYAMYLAAFALLGFISGSSWWSFSAYLMDLATPEQRPSYLAVSGLLKSPVSVVSIVVGAVFAVLNAELMFALALAVSLLAAAMTFKLPKFRTNAEPVPQTQEAL